MTTAKRLLCGLSLALIATVPLLAKVVTSTTRTGNFTFAGAVLVPLTNGGATAVSFSGKGRHAISFSAECETSADWLSIQIFVDGVALSPTGGTSDSFCSDHNDNNALDGWTTAHYTVATPSLGAGVHIVQIQGSVVGSGTGWLGDISLVVEK
jgi:hypothetical protein